MDSKWILKKTYFEWHHEWIHQRIFVEIRIHLMSWHRTGDLGKCALGPQYVANWSNIWILFNNNCRIIQQKWLTTSNSYSVGDSLPSDPCKIALTWVKLNVPTRAFTSGHKVTVGNGIVESEEVLSSKPTFIGCSFHSDRTFWIDFPHNQSAKPTITIHNIRSLQCRLRSVI